MIYANGDSWTSGWPDEEIYGHKNFSWPYLLSLKLNTQVINDARAGCSNDRIYRRTFDYLLSNRPQTAIICLTSWLRFELGNAQTGKIHQYIPGHGHDCSMYKDNWHPYLAYSNFLRQIISLQTLATINGINLFLIDTFDNNLIRQPTREWFIELLKMSNVFDLMDDDRTDQKFNKIVELNKFIKYDMFIFNASYQSLIDGSKLVKGHPIQDGHERIADMIYHAINNKGVTHG